MAGKERSLFKSVRAHRPGKSVFDLSYSKLFTCDMGELVPILCDEVVPGDVWSIGNEIVIRFQPMIAPILHEVNVYVHYFFVPYRLLWGDTTGIDEEGDWETFISGGFDGTDESVQPTWAPTSAWGESTLWDYLGFPVPAVVGGLTLPTDWPRRAYNFIYNEYFRDETLVDEVSLVNESLLIRAWEKDYFTSALPFQQRGTDPALPLSGFGTVAFDGNIYGVPYPGAGAVIQLDNDTINDGNLYLDGAIAQGNLQTFFDNNRLDFSDAVTFNVADLRLAFQIQRWLERNARAGVRYIEFLKAHFGVSPSDDRLQRPEYIGGTKSPVIISEVLQTSSTDMTSPQANMAGHGLGVSQQLAAKYRCEEFGLIMGIMSVMPRTMYQQGLDRQWQRQTRYDYYFPEFANLSEQAVLQGELYYVGDSTDQNIFGYQGRYDELRYKRNQVSGQMRSSLDYWHLSRIFSGAPALNETFINCVPRKNIFAVEDVDGLIVSVGNLLRVVRPMPLDPEPGLIDHDA